MNILFVHEVSYSDKVVFDYQLLAEAMAKRHHGVFAIDYPNKNKSCNEEFVSRTSRDTNVCLIHPPAIQVNGLRRISAFVSNYFEIEKIINKYSIEAIALYSVPTNGLQVLVIAKRHGIPVIFRSLDVLHKLVKNPLLSRITYNMEKQVYSEVDRILTITPKLSDYVVKMGAYQNKVSVLPMPVDCDIFKPFDYEGKALRKKWGLSVDDDIVLFMGTLFKFSGLDSFIPHFQKVIRRIPGAKLLIVGDGEQRNALKNLIFDLGLADKVIITGFQPYSDMPAYINIADVCVNTFIPNGVTNDIFPGKTVQYLACGKPLVMRPLDGVKAVIKGEDQGVVYTDDDEQMALAIINLLEDSKRRYDIGLNGFQYAKQNHSCSKVAGQLDEVIKESL